MSIPLEPGKQYHIYNHANGKEQLFLNPGNYHYFLKRYKELVSPYLNTFTYCLMPNHFHLLVQIKPEEELKSLPAFRSEKPIPEVISKKLSNFFSAYTQAFNKQQGRKGSLFMKNFKRKNVTDETYLRKLIHYIHYNPVHHGYVDGVEAWPYSSYRAITSSEPSEIMKKEVVAFFDDLENFKYCHKHPPKITGIE